MEMDRPGDPKRVREMFGGIAQRYDLLNHLLSANLDRRWRRAAVRSVPAGGAGRVLDLCGGTGDLAIDLIRGERAAEVICCDFSHPMLLLARDKFRRLRIQDRCHVLEADALGLPFANGSFDAVTVGFGVRNFSCLESGLREIHRVLKPSGSMVVLEFSQPTGPLFSRLYRFYLNRILPRLGDWIGQGRGAYRYLASTISEFPDPPGLAGRIRSCGFASCGWTRLTGGIVAVHVGHKQAVIRPRAARATTPSARAAGSRPAEKSPSVANRRPRR